MQFLRLPLVDRLTSIPLMAAGILFSTNVLCSSDKLNLYLLLRKWVDILIIYIILRMCICFYLQLSTLTTLTLLGENMMQVRETHRLLML